jgi:hypothetical protein
MTLLGYTRVPKATLRTGHVYWVTDDGIKDLGPVTLEDLRLLEYVTQEAAGRLTATKRKGGPSALTLSRVRAFARRLHLSAK